MAIRTTMRTIQSQVGTGILSLEAGRLYAERMAGGGVEPSDASSASRHLPALRQARTVSTGSVVAVGDVARDIMLSVQTRFRGRHRGRHRTSISGTPGIPDSRNHAVAAKPGRSNWPREESNLRTRIRSPLLYPLSYGAAAYEG